MSLFKGLFRGLWHRSRNDDSGGDPEPAVNAYTHGGLSYTHGGEPYTHGA